MTTDRRAAPLREYADETWAQWIARQGNPTKPKSKTGRRSSSEEERPASNGMAAGSTPACITHHPKEKDPIVAVAAAPGSIASTHE